MQNLVEFGSVISEGMCGHTYIVLRNNIWFHYDQFGFNYCNQMQDGMNSIGLVCCYVTKII